MGETFRRSIINADNCGIKLPTTSASGNFNIIFMNVNSQLPGNTKNIYQYLLTASKNADGEETPIIEDSSNKSVLVSQIMEDNNVVLGVLFSASWCTPVCFFFLLFFQELTFFFPSASRLQKS